MSGERITRVTLEEARALKGETDWERLRREEALGIEPAYDPDIDDVDWDWDNARFVPATKKQVTVRLDRDVLEFFQKDGRGYQTRINAVLRAYVDAKQKR